MKALEIIHLRSAGEPIDVLSQRISASMSQCGHHPPPMALYRRRGLETDLAVHLPFDSASEAATHEIALQLASELRAYGLVEHTRWEELP